MVRIFGADSNVHLKNQLYSYHALHLVTGDTSGSTVIFCRGINESANGSGDSLTDALMDIWNSWVGGPNMADEFKIKNVLVRGAI